METPTELSLSFTPLERVVVDWSKLPSNLLDVISKKLHDLFDFTYFRAICKNWRTATSISELPHQISWLLEKRQDINDQVLRFYSLGSGKTRSIRCPQSCGMNLFGPTHGFLCAADIDSPRRRFVLLNPITRQEVHVYFEKYRRPGLVCMGPDPIGSGDHMVFMGDLDYQTAGFYQPRSMEWHYVGVPDFRQSSCGACLEGRYYTNEIITCNTVVGNISFGTSFLVPAPPDDENLKNCLVEVCFVESAGRILRIVKQSDFSSDVSANCSFDIYQLHSQNSEHRWVKTSNIGNQILFLDCLAGMSVTACENTGLKGNCIYYMHNRPADFNVVLSHDVYKYNIEDGQTEKISTPFDDVATWLVPSLAPVPGDGFS